MEGLSSSPVTTTRDQECEWVAGNVPRDPVLCKEREKDEVPKGTTFGLDKTKYRPRLALFFLCSNTGLSTAELDLSSSIGEIDRGRTVDKRDSQSWRKKSHKDPNPGNKTALWGQSHSTDKREFTLHMADPGSITGSPYGPVSLPRAISK